MGLRKFLQKRRMWKLETLADFWFVANWMEQQRQAGNQDEALATYYVAMTNNIRNNIPKYLAHLDQLEKRTGGVLTGEEAAENAGLTAPSDTLLAMLIREGEKLKAELDTLSKQGTTAVVNFWKSTLSQPANYVAFITRLVQKFGNFEIIAMSMPGTGEVIIRDDVQQSLANLYRINTQHIRMMEMINSIHRNWHANPPKAGWGFFKEEAKMSDLARLMFVEYMMQADPKRVAAAREKARVAGRRFHKYRFWRPAETVRQMAAVKYDQQRRPKPLRKYVDISVDQAAPPICADMQRLEWAMKEVFNNAIGATSQMIVTPDGLVAKPLDKHREFRTHPIQVKVETYETGGFMSKQQMVRLTIADSGVGIPDHDVPHVIKWAYSTRRKNSDETSQQTAAALTGEEQELIIGGKGIGLPFSRATVRDHGGELNLVSVEGQGTTVTFDLPAPTPYTAM